MRTIRTKVYNFEELVVDAQQNAIEANQSINVDFDWWRCAYEDAENIGLKITGFDLDYKCIATGNFICDSISCANNIINSHGEECESYKISAKFIYEWNEAVKLHSDGIHTDKVMEGKEFDFDYYMEDREGLFLKDILNYYVDYLRKEYDYRLSEEAIRETIIANEYEFTKDGYLFNS